MGWGQKFTGTLFLLLSSQFAFAAVTDAADGDRYVEVKVKQVYVSPTGFDDNDHVEAFVTGELPNPCYTIDKAEAKLDEATRTIQIRQFAWLSQRENCVSGDLYWTPVSYSSVVQLGTLRSADYTLSFQRDFAAGAFPTFHVDAAKKGAIDNFQYANVRSIDSDEFYPLGRDVNVVMHANLTSNYLELQRPVEVKMQGNVILIIPTVLPTVEPVDGKPTCEHCTYPIKETLNLGKLAAGTYAIHVRSRGGRGVFQTLTVH
jgi:hypothetical protein